MGDITAIVPVSIGVDVEELRAFRETVVQLEAKHEDLRPVIAKLARHVENAVGETAWLEATP